MRRPADHPPHKGARPAAAMRVICKKALPATECDRYRHCWHMRSDGGEAVNARIDLAIIAGLADDPNDQTGNDAQPARGRADPFLRHFAGLLDPWTAVRLRSCGKSDRG